MADSTTTARVRASESTSDETAGPDVPDSVAQDADRPRWITRHRVALFGGAILLCVTALTWGGLGEMIWGGEPIEPAPIVHAPPDEGDRPETPEEREARWRRDAIGKWHTFYRGNRYMTVRPDGTGTVVANLEEYNAFELWYVGADRVVFDIEWRIENGALQYDTVGGRPAASVKTITDKYGADKIYPIVHLTDEEFRYQSDIGDPDYIWTRLPDDTVIDDTTK